MKKKGFTLIELLAVIIILAVIALIATPIVMNVIDNVQERANQASVAGYADAVKTTAYEYYLNNQAYPTTIDTTKVVNQGDKVYCENVLYSKDHGVVLNNCSVKEETNEKKYCFAEGKTYDDCSNQEYQDVLAALPPLPKPVKNELLKQYNESNTVGLLKDDTGYYYKGTNEEVANNFVWFGGHLWRVLTINEDNSLTMITQQPVTSISLASSVWTTQEAYEASYINHWLNDETDGVFYKSLEKVDKAKIQDSVFNVGIYNNVSEITTTQKVGLLDETQYTKAGGKNSFLDIKDYWWLGNRYSTSIVRSVFNDGNLLNSGPSNAYGVRAVIKISNLTFTEGEGTLSNPYREKSTATNMAQVKVGEYISIPTSGSDCGEDNRCLFRVVSKDGNKIKVTLNGLLSSESAFGTSETYTSGNTIDAKVKAFAETIDSKYRYSGTDTTFGIGTYGSGANYTAVQGTKYQGTVGLPVVGEMFTSNDIDLSTSATKTFVNVATIEHPTLSNYFWTMNAYRTSLVRNVDYNGNLDYYGPSRAFGVRAVLYLNGSSSLTFTSGEGTAEHPFMLGE